MEFIKYFRTSIFQVTSLVCVLGFLLGVLNLHFSDKTNYCVMTYMYEYPQFVRIHFNDNIDYPAYGLYAYSEGRLTEKARKMRFDGIPVLFLPGNAGSHMQARSLASVALRKALSKGNDFHFDFFTISYNEELTGLYGGTLSEQVEFAAKSINKILDLYSANKYTKHVPTHVIVIGHSMGGVVANRLLAYHETVLSTRIAITLAAPLEAPVILFDNNHDSFYRDMEDDWINNVNGIEDLADRKVLISFGNGPRDVLVPSGLTSYNHSFINALTTAVPGAWVSPDHVCIVWCKQMVMTINKYLFSLVDLNTQQIVEDMRIVKDKAKHFFFANRAITLDSTKPLLNAMMVADAFWYEDNRRMYQVSRPGIEKMTYLMVRLVDFPQNRFVAIEAVNVDDQEWVFGCNAKFTFNVHRYCKNAASLSQLSRWTAAANNFGKRKLATIHLHDLKRQHPDWTHVIVKVSPTKKPITLNVDINDHASRQIEVTPPSLLFSFGKQRTIISQTEQDSLYYELLLKDFSTLPEAYLLYVEPTMSCKEYHVSAEVYVPWAKNHEYFHYFTHLKRSPMKIRLFKSNPNVTMGEKATEFVKVTILLDPRCSFTVSISTSWYHSLGQVVRNYTPLLIPYIVGLIIMAAASNIYHLWDTGSCVPIHTALDSELLKPYYVMFLAKFLFFALLHIPFMWFIFDYSSYGNNELQWVIRSLLVFPAYMVALGVINILIAGELCVMAFSSQLDRLIFRIFWGAGTSIGERLAYALRKVPMVLSAVMVAAVPMSCGAASLAIGAAFYAYMISKMFEDYFEDLIYKLFAKVASKLCRLVRRKPKNTNAKGEEIKWRNLRELEQEGLKTPKKKYSHEARDEDLSNLNFHMMMFSIWMVTTLLNLPTLLAWARNFKYETKLNSDPSFEAGLVLSACSGYIWQLDGPRKYLNHYAHISALLYVIGVFVIILGPFSLAVANYAVVAIFCTITLQQLIDYENTTIDERTYNDLYGLNETDKQEENERHIAEKRNKLDFKKKTNRRASVRIRNYLGQLTFDAKRRVRNMINNRRNSKESAARISNDINDKNTSYQSNTKDDTEETVARSRTSNSEVKYNNKDNSKNEQLESDNERNKGNNEGGKSKSNTAESESNNTESESNNADNSKGRKTNDASNNAGSSENCDVCDESSIYTVFKNLREKLSFTNE